MLLVAIDHATKLAALAFLPRHEAADRSAGFQLLLRLNESGVGVWTSLLWPEVTPAEVAAEDVAWLGLAAALLVVRRWGVRRPWKVTVCIAAFVLGSLVGDAMVPALQLWSDYALQVFRLGSGAAFWLTLWWLAPCGLWKTTLALFTATALGNFLSLLYPPFRVVDFVYSSFLWDTIRMGVFNFADMCGMVGLVFLAWATLRAVGRRLFGRATSGKPS